MTPSTPSLLALALTGEVLEFGDDFHGVEDFLAELAEAGWPASRVRAHAQARRNEALAWPHPLPPDSLDRFSPAQWYAQLGQVRAALDLDVARQAPSRRRELTIEEKRLAAEVPPHHGPAG